MNHNENTPDDPEEDNIYIYTDEPEELENREEPESTSPFWLMVKVLVSPVEGWKSVRRSKIATDKFMKECFYPLLILLSVSKFARLIYSSRVKMADIIVDSISSFVAFFFGYFCILILFRIVMTVNARSSLSSEFAKQFVAISLSTLCLFFSTLEFFPILWAVLIFLPLWTVYVICKGVRFFRFPEDKEILNTSILVTVIIGVPCVLDWILQNVLPGL